MRAGAAPSGGIDAPPDRAARPYRLDEQVGFILRQVQQRHSLIFGAAFGEETTPLQWAALAKLAEVGTCSQNQLGRLIATDVATIKGVVERLVRRGLVDARADAGDRRRLLLDLTRDGRDVYVAFERKAAEVSDATLEPLSRRDRDLLLSLLERLR